ncbi:MAG: mechanosensitive ion channel family protein [Actinomycetota bacterium]
MMTTTCSPLTTERQGFMAWQQAPPWVTDTVVPHAARITGIVLGAILLRWLFVRVIRRFVQRSAQASWAVRLGANPATRVLAQAAGVTAERHRQRTQTLGSVLGSVITGIVFVVAFLMILGDLGVEVAPMLASAGVAGVALGFGAQHLVRDFLSGMFLVLEDQYGVGDVIDVGGVTGTVEAVSLRITQIRDGHGATWYVRNGEITRVVNRSQGWSTAVVDVRVSPHQDLAVALTAVRSAAAAVGADDQWRGVLLEAPLVVGIEQLTDQAAIIQITAKTTATKEADVARDLRERCLHALITRGVRLPDQHPPMPPTNPEQ